MRQLSVIALLLSLVLAAFYVPGLYADDSTAAAIPEDIIIEEVEADDVLTASPFAQTAFVFPNAPTRDLHAGKPAEVLIGFKNVGPKPYLFTSLKGGLYYNLDARYFLENYTSANFDTVINPNEQYSFAYRFLPHSMLEEGEFGLLIQGFYHDNDGGNFSSIIFNSTINIVEPVETLDVQSLFQYAFIVALGALGGFLLYKSFGSVGGKKRYTSERGTTSSADADEWLQGTNALNRSGPKKRTVNKGSKGSA